MRLLSLSSLQNNYITRAVFFFVVIAGFIRRSAAVELNESIRSRAHRTLRRLKNFRSGDQADIPDAVRAQFLPSEELLGVYVNAPVEPTANLVFTTRGVYHFAGDSWLCLAYADTASVDIVRGENFRKLLADALVFRDKAGKARQLTVSGGQVRDVAGGDLRFADIYEVLHFLQRVLTRVKYEGA
jgi:hypothetical protein